MLCHDAHLALDVAEFVVGSNLQNVVQDMSASMTFGRGKLSTQRKFGDAHIRLVMRRLQKDIAQVAGL